MEFREYLPFWKELTSQQQAKLESSATLEHVKRAKSSTTAPPTVWACWCW